ncbi:MAG: DnaJ domain-containing protein [Lachnospiraceae bacterium]|nr:DnaJ domain-containing protein [Lachnospiraceae bacterium]
MIQSRAMACSILGINSHATLEEAKRAYKRLVKVYHPDAGYFFDASKYREIHEAYQYILNHPAPPTTSRIIGSGTTMPNRMAEYHAFNTQMKKQKEQRSADFFAAQKKKDDEYRKAMDAINNIIVAENLKKLIRDQL